MLRGEEARQLRRPDERGEAGCMRGEAGCMREAGGRSAVLHATLCGEAQAMMVCMEDACGAQCASGGVYGCARARARRLSREQRTGHLRPGRYRPIPRVGSARVGSTRVGSTGIVRMGARRLHARCTYSVGKTKKASVTHFCRKGNRVDDVFFLRRPAGGRRKGFRPLHLARILLAAQLTCSCCS